MILKLKATNSVIKSLKQNVKGYHQKSTEPNTGQYLWENINFKKRRNVLFSYRLQDQVRSEKENSTEKSKALSH